MTDTQLKHDQPNLTEKQTLLALLSETYEVARHLEMTLADFKVAKGDALEEQIASAGKPEEVKAASIVAQANIMKVLTCISEQDLEDGRDAGLLTPEDHTEALISMRALALARGRSTEREDEREI